MKICDICSRTRRAFFNRQTNKILCEVHRSHLRMYGKIKKITIRTKNQYIINKNIVEIILRGRQGEETARTIIDKEDLERISIYKWHRKCKKEPYVKTTTLEKDIPLHRFIIGATKNDIVDHIDRNPLNNRKSNLRITDKRGNALNSKIRNDNTSGTCGVSYRKDKKKWGVRMMINGKYKSFGSYAKKEDAIKIRKKLEEKYV